MKDLIIFMDSGDTLVDESTEVRDETGTVIYAEFFKGACEILKTLYEKGYTIALVADGKKASFDNVYSSSGLNHCFAARSISVELGCEKPAETMFLHAMEELGLNESDRERIVMVGNNLKRDIAGAKRMGITTILAGYSPRYDMRPKNPAEIPDYVIASPSELVDLIEQLNLQVRNKRILSQPISDTVVFKE